jgi:transposase
MNLTDQTDAYTLGELKALVKILCLKVEQLTLQVDTLQLENQQLKEENLFLKKENALLKEKNEHLVRLSSQNSNNSHLPPSLDKIKNKLQPTSSKLKKGKKGGQEGHKGKTLGMSSTPHITEACLPGLVCKCGTSLEREALKLKAIRQVFDLPSLELEVKQYEQYSCQCKACGEVNIGTFPAQVSSNVQYGERTFALCSLLSNDFNLSCAHIKTLFQSLFGQPLNEATILKANQRVYQALWESEQVIKTALLASPLAHVDETGVSVGARISKVVDNKVVDNKVVDNKVVDNKVVDNLQTQQALYWLHTFTTKEFTYFFAHSKRGKQALESEASLVKDYQGYLVHDFFSSYFSFPKVKHILCNAHLIRELEALKEVGTDWAEQMQNLLLDIYQASGQGKSSVKEGLEIFWTVYDQICQWAEVEEPLPKTSKRGRPKKSKGRNLLERFRSYKSQILAFASQDFIPFTNNEAERALRPIKSKVKVAGCFRSQEGINHYCRIKGFISTARKQGQLVFNELINALNGFTFLTTTSSIG